MSPHSSEQCELHLLELADEMASILYIVDALKIFVENVMILQHLFPQCEQKRDGDSPHMSQTPMSLSDILFRDASTTLLDQDSFII